MRFETTFNWSDSKGDPLNPSQPLIDQLFETINTVSESKTKVVTLEDFSRKKWELENQLTKFTFQSKAEINFLGRGEICLALQAHCLPKSDHSLTTTGNQSVGPVANAQWLKTWFSEERLPVELGWRKPSQITLLGTLSLMRKAKKIQRSFG